MPPFISDNIAMKASLNNSQQELHKWDAADQVAFVVDKESEHVLSLTDPLGGTSKLLGVTFDSEVSIGRISS